MGGRSLSSTRMRTLGRWSFLQPRTKRLCFHALSKQPGVDKQNARWRFWSVSIKRVRIPLISHVKSSRHTLSQLVRRQTTSECHMPTSICLVVTTSWWGSYRDGAHDTDREPHKRVYTAN